MKNTMWSGRFEGASSELLQKFNASLEVDSALFRQDIQGSIAHASMLAKCKIISKDELRSIIDGLRRIEDEIESGVFEFRLEDEDIHMAVEKRLGQIIDPRISGKLHTARSRNDQVATDFKLFVRQSHRELIALLKNLMKTLINHAKEHKTSIMPSFTHLQHAQPVSFAFYVLAYAFMFQRDVLRLENSLALLDECPLGSCACAGTSYKTDRELSASLLGFARPAANAMDAVSDRDFALDLLYDIAVIFTHTSRLCEEMILFSSAEFGFISISDSFSTGSSIMPQKKNPDVCELIRGKTGRVYGNLIALLTTMKALPLAYNKDMQEDKEGLFDSVKTAKDSLTILNAMLQEMRIHKENMLKACQKGHLLATDLADYLVREKNIPFREAHFIVGRVVAEADRRGVDLSEIENLSAIDPIFDDKAMQCLSFEHSLNAKQSSGSSSIKSVEAQIQALDAFLNAH